MKQKVRERVWERFDQDIRKTHRFCDRYVKQIFLMLWKGVFPY